MSGHVFIVHGDLRRLSCDAWLMPCDASASPLERWLGWPEGTSPRLARQLRPARWHAAGERTFPVQGWPTDLPQPWLTMVGGAPHDGFSWFAQGAAQFLDRAARALAARPPRHARARHLLALPIVGTGHGGARRHTGEVLRDLLPRLYEAAREHDLDVALVTNEQASFAAAQAERLRVADAWAGLPEPLRVEGLRLARLAAHGKLVLFVGAGVSVGAGLPTWPQMLARLAVEAGLRPEERAGLERLDALDRARIVEGRLLARGRPLGKAIADSLSSVHPSLAHHLLAALPVREVVTTNYDRLFEYASEGAGRAVSVLPHDARVGTERWLLKLHGCVSAHDDIVLTREDYMHYAERRAALAGIVQALLITRHMLFVGFSMNDDNFHRIADAVRRAVKPQGGQPAPFGTTVVLHRDRLVEELWRGDVQWVPTGDDDLPQAQAARRLDVLLDYVVAQADVATAHLLDDRYEGALSAEDEALRDLLQRVEREAGDAAKRAPGWARVEAMLEAFGSRRALLESTRTRSRRRDG